MRGRHAAVRVPATTANLGPGFDSFGAALSRYLWARSVPPGDGARVRTTGGSREVAGLPTGDDNLVWRAVVRFCEDVGEPVPDVAVRVRTAIPLERGLGSSSAAIVGGLALGRALTGATVGQPELVELATDLEGHPDNVAPAVLGGLVVATSGRGGTRVVRRAAPAPRLRPVVLVPGERQSTREARALLPETLTREEAATQAGRAAHVLAALLGAWPVAPVVTGDLLHEPPRLEAMPVTGALLRRLRRAGVHAWLSGAGPTVAAAVGRRDGQLEACRQAAGAGVEVVPLEWDLAGVVTCPEGGCAWAAGPACRTCPREMVAREV